MGFPFNDDGTLASTIGEKGQRIPTEAALDAFDALIGGGVQTIQLLESAEIDLATLVADTVVLTVPAGALLIKAFALRSNTATTGVAPNRIQLRISAAGESGGNDLITYDLTNAYAGNLGDDVLAEDGGDTYTNDPALLINAFGRAARRATGDMDIKVKKTNVTDGLMRVYALIATPAA